MGGLDKFFKNSEKPEKKITENLRKKAIPQVNSENMGKTQDSKKIPENYLENEKQIQYPEIVQLQNRNEVHHPFPNSSIEGQEMEQNQVQSKIIQKFTKFRLECTNKKCNYKRILMKLELSKNDLYCPKCKCEMLQK